MTSFYRPPNAPLTPSRSLKIRIHKLDFWLAAAYLAVILNLISFIYYLWRVNS